MQINDIKNPTLRKLFEEVRHHSATIEADAGDALEESRSDEELIDDWQSKLESLNRETQYFWGTLENIKFAPSSQENKKGLALQWIDEYTKDKGRGWVAHTAAPSTLEEYSTLFDKLVGDGYKVYAEFRDGRYHVYVKRRQ